jgi:hypothetical protein
MDEERWLRRTRQGQEYKEDLEIAGKYNLLFILENDIKFITVQQILHFEHLII